MMQSKISLFLHLVPVARSQIGQGANLDGVGILSKEKSRIGRLRRI